MLSVFSVLRHQGLPTTPTAKEGPCRDRDGALLNPLGAAQHAGGPAVTAGGHAGRSRLAASSNSMHRALSGYAGGCRPFASSSSVAAVLVLCEDLWVGPVCLPLVVAWAFLRTTSDCSGNAEMSRWAGPVWLPLVVAWADLRTTSDCFGSAEMSTWAGLPSCGSTAQETRAHGERQGAGLRQQCDSFSGHRCVVGSRLLASATACVL